MTKQAIIDSTVRAIGKLPQEKAKEVLDFVLMLLKRQDEQLLAEGLHQLADSSEAMAFLMDEEDQYTLADVKKPYHGQG